MIGISHKPWVPIPNEWDRVLDIARASGWEEYIAICGEVPSSEAEGAYLSNGFTVVKYARKWGHEHVDFRENLVEIVMSGWTPKAKPWSWCFRGTDILFAFSSAEDAVDFRLRLG